MHCMFLLGINLFILVINGNQLEQIYKRFMEDKLMTGYAYKLDGVKSLTKCAMVCLNVNCDVYSFHKQTQECFLYENIHDRNSTSAYSGLVTFGREGICADSRYTLYKDLDICLKGYMTYYVTWDSANATCDRYGGRLLFRKQFTETTLALETLSLPGDYYWLGGRPVDGIWAWTDGTTMNMTTGWGPFDPDFYNSKYCLQYYSINDKMCDWICTSLNAFVCEMKVL